MTTDKTILIGDPHGMFYNYREILKTQKANVSIALGDIGLGFPQSPELILSDIPGTNYLLRGNHDNPIVMRKHPNYIGDYGILNGSFIEDRFDKLFFLSGAWSIDWQYRTEGLTIWNDEQLSQEELCAAINLHNETKPDIMIAHDCPTMILHHLHPSRVIPTRTSQALDQMVFNHKPNYFIFAHHHISWRKLIDDCMYVCLNELEVLDISKSITNGGQQ